jgi:hypothetical protein
VIPSVDVDKAIARIAKLAGVDDFGCSIINPGNSGNPGNRAYAAFLLRTSSSFFC